MATGLFQSRRNQLLLLCIRLRSLFKSKDPMLWLLKPISGSHWSSLALPYDHTLKQPKRRSNLSHEFKASALTALEEEDPVVADNTDHEQFTAIFWIRKELNDIKQQIAKLRPSMVQNMDAN